METTAADITQNETTKMFLRFPTLTAQNKKVSAKMDVTGGSSPSRGHSNGSSILVKIASTNPGK